MSSISSRATPESLPTLYGESRVAHTLLLPANGCSRVEKALYIAPSHAPSFPDFLPSTFTLPFLASSDSSLPSRTLSAAPSLLPPATLPSPLSLSLRSERSFA